MQIPTGVRCGVWACCLPVFLVVLFTPLASQTELPPPPPFVIELPPDLDALPEVPPRRFSDEVLIEVLNRYEGKWEGEYTISTMQGDVMVRSLVAQQHYWWDMEEDRPLLRGRGIYANESDITHSEMLSFIERGHIFGMVSQNGVIRFFRGRVLDDMSGVLWMPTGEERVLGGQSTERFSNENATSVLKIEGFEPYRLGNEEIMLVMKGHLRKTEDE